MPELIWMVPIHHHYEASRAIELCLEVVAAAQQTSNQGDSGRNYTFVSSYNGLSKDKAKEVTEILLNRGALSAIRAALDPLFRLYPDCPMSFLASKQDCVATTQDINWFEPLLEGFFDRRSQSSMIIQANVVYHSSSLGKIKYSKEVEPPDLEAIVADYSSESARKSSAQVRATINAFVGHLFDELNDEWPKYFWRRNLDLAERSALKIDLDDLKDYPSEKPWTFLRQFIENAAAGLVERWRQLPKNLYEPEAVEVIGALLARQLSIARRLASNPGVWDFHVGPIILRSMVDTHISLAWLLKDPQSRSQKFILYGLGQEKLQVEKLKAGARSNDDAVKMMIEAKEEWINSQQYTFLTIVDVGSWSGTSTRSMAEEAGLMELYDHAYVPWSTCAHSMWNHIERFNTQYSSNPYLRHLREPDDLHMKPQIDVLLNAAKYLQRSYDAVDTAFALDVKIEPPWDFLIEALNEGEMDE